MIYAIPMVAACLLATWFCRWATGGFAFLRNRECRVACLSCPVLLSLLVIGFPEVVLRPLSDFLAGLTLSSGRLVAAFMMSLAVSLTVPTLLITSLIGQLRTLGHRKSVAK